MRLNDLTLPLELSQRTTASICIALACITFFTFFYCVWQWYDDWKLTHQTIVVTPTIKTETPVDIVASISENHLFGQSPKLGEMPISNLQLRVTGIVKTDSDQFHPGSKAYISISGQPSKIYKIGDDLPDGVKVYDITPDAVVLKNEGRLEKLPLPREKLQFKSKQQIEEQSQ